MKETLITCPTCSSPNFTARGLKAHRCNGINRQLSAPPVGAKSSEQTAVATGTISTRLERIRSWHNVSREQAWQLKLIVFFAGMEIQALKDDLGVTERQRTDIDGTAETVSAVTNGKATTWEELVELECGMTYRTAQNYVTAYHNICAAAPSFAEAILKVAAPRLDGKKACLALPDPGAVIAKIPEEELEKFRDATDPWSLREIYARPMKAAQAQIVEEIEKAKSKQREVQGFLKFWFDELESNVKRHTYLRLPRKQRELLLNTLEITVSEIKESLKSK